MAAEPELLITVCLCQETESRQRVDPGYNPYGLRPVICFFPGVSTSSLPRDTTSILTWELVRDIHI